MKVLRLLACMLCTVHLLVFHPRPATAADPILLRFSHVVGENTPKGYGARRFKELAEQRLRGRVTVEIYPASSKFTDEQALLALLFGDLELAAPSFSKFCRFNRALEVFDLPYLFADLEAVHAFQQSDTGQDLLHSMEDMGLRGLQYWDNGFRVIATDRPVSLPDDLRGMTFRIEPSGIVQRQYLSLGSSVIAMPFKQLPDMLRSGVVDGHENTWSNIVAHRLYPTPGHIVETNHSYLGYLVVTSTRFWQALPLAVRQELENILEEVTGEVNRLAQSSNARGRAELVRLKGVQVTTPDAACATSWKNAMLPAWDEFSRQSASDMPGAVARRPGASGMP